MASFNKVIVMGNLGQDPELRYTLSQKAVTTLSIATDRPVKDANGKWTEQTDWHRAVVWAKDAERCAEYLKKGDPVFIEGRLQTRQYEKDGKKQYATEIVAESVRFLGRAKANGAAAEEPPPAGGGEAEVAGADDEIPF
jgi:single-strand DNA-binding protein